MKHTRLAVLLAFGFIALLSCYWNANLGEGEVKIDLSEIEAKGPGDVVRVYLLANEIPIIIGDNRTYIELPISGFGEQRIVTIKQVAAGSRYRILVGEGNVSNNTFTVYYFGESDLFEVTAGQEVTVPVYLDWFPPFPVTSVTFSSDLAGKVLKSVASGSFYLYTAEQSRLYALDTGSFSLMDTYDFGIDPDGYGVKNFKINSLSSADSIWNGYDALVDSDKGILPFTFFGEGWDFRTDFSQTLGGSTDVHGSGMFITGLAAAEYNVFFRRSYGLGGVFIPPSTLPADWTWVNLDATGVTDLALSYYYTYYATAGGAFAVPANLLQDTTPTLAEHRLSFGAPDKIISLAFYPVSVNEPNGTLYLGTTNGVWTATVTEDDYTQVPTPPGVTLGTLSRIPETEGHSITDIVIRESDDDVAIISRSYLFILKDGSVTKIPFFAVLPGKPSGMSFPSADLFISGSEGLVKITLWS